MEERAEQLTPAQRDRLEAELAELEGPKRAEIVDAIRTARGFGDLSENFEYHAAKNEQGLLERRVTILRDRLRRSVLVEQSPVGTHVSVGSHVTIARDDGENMELEISSVDGVSPDSPLGKALLGAKAGDEVVVHAPQGDWRARILSVS